MKAWYFDTTCNNPRAPCQLENVSRETLLSLGVEHFHFDADNHEKDETYAKFKRERGYDYQDIVTVSRESMPDYDTKVASFLREHIHDDEETRAITDGKGYFDVRDKSDKWIRIEVEKGDLLVLPAGIYHRFVPTMDDYVRAIRLFVGHPVWTPINRDVGEDDIAKSHARVGYLKMIN